MLLRRLSLLEGSDGSVMDELLAIVDTLVSPVVLLCISLDDRLEACSAAVFCPLSAIMLPFCSSFLSQLPSVSDRIPSEYYPRSLAVNVTLHLDGKVHSVSV